jgi:hypothetical protein
MSGRHWRYGRALYEGSMTVVMTDKLLSVHLGGKLVDARLINVIGEICCTVTVTCNLQICFECCVFDVAVLRSRGRCRALQSLIAALQRPQLAPATSVVCPSFLCLSGFKLQPSRLLLFFFYFFFFFILFYFILFSFFYFFFFIFYFFFSVLLSLICYIVRQTKLLTLLKSPHKFHYFPRPSSRTHPLPCPSIAAPISCPVLLVAPISCPVLLAAPISCPVLLAALIFCPVFL